MKYDFNTTVNRNGLNSYKYRDYENVLSMWIADMDYDTPDFIKKPLIERLSKGAYGYEYEGENFYQSIIAFYQRKYQITLPRKAIMFSVGVIPSLISIIRATTKENDPILVCTPAYPMFKKTIESNKRVFVECPLVYENDSYTIDYALLEKQLQTVKVLIWCNPHNPIGKVFTKEEIQLVVDLCLKYDVLIISDEIHCELTYNQYQFHSLLNWQINNLIVCIAPTKTFNLAGIKTSSIITYNNDYQKLIQKQLQIDHANSVNVLASIASVVAYNEGDSYVEQLLQHLYHNYEIFKTIEQSSQLKVMNLEATYLIWIDCSAYIKDSNHFVKYLKDNYQLIVSSGYDFLGNGKQFIRMNIATSEDNIIIAKERLLVALKHYQE